ncbi:hypothetical protein HS5152_0753 [Enterococcus faecalis]|nr:hypothetical protein P790_0922 [Enterococcus faecalis NJ44]OSH11486.1 hypothetical protein HS5152_0753 [Enterococcus faecalis]OSH15156.1 hypothetical protein HS5302_2449 [Enterococcus faecalis]
MKVNEKVSIHTFLFYLDIPVIFLLLFSKNLLYIYQNS